MCIIHGVLTFLLLGSVPGILCYTIDVETTNCDPPLSRNASSVAQVIYIKPSAKISCTWTILIDGDNCLEIYYTTGADLEGAFLEIASDNEREVQPLVNTSVCSAHHVTIYYRHNMTDSRVSGTDLYLYYLTVPEREHTVLNKLGTTTAAVGSTEKNGGTSPGVIAVAVLIPVLLIGIGAILAYVWYRRKYPVRMIVGKDFAKFSNPAYNKRASTATLVRENAALDDYQKDIEEGAAYTGVSHDNPALNMEDDPQYQPIPALIHSVTSYSNYRRSFEDSPDLGKRAPEKPRRLHSNYDSKSDSIESVEAENKNKQTTADVSLDSVIATYDSVDSGEKDSPLYENVESNVIDKINVDKSAKMTSDRMKDDISDHETYPGETSQEYEDVSPTATEDEHTYDTALHSSLNYGPKDTPIENSNENSGDTSIDDFQIYENVSLGEESIKDEERNSITGGDSDRLSNNVSSSERDEAGDAIDFPHSPVTPDSFQDSFSSESFVVLDQSDSAELGVNQAEYQTEHIDKTSTQESHSSGSEEHVGHVDNEVIDQNEALPNETQSRDERGTGYLREAETVQSDTEVNQKDAKADRKDTEADRSFDMDVNNLDISVSSISDPDGKSFDSAFSFVSHDLKPRDESSDSFEVISHEQASGFTDNNKYDVGEDSLQQSAEILEGKIHEESKLIDSEHEQNSTVSKTIKPDLNISFHDSSESDSVDGEEDAATAEIDKMVDSSKERRESVTRKIGIDHGSISFDDSSDSSHSDDEKPKPSVLRRESITLDNPNFDSPNINLSLKFSSEETVDKSEQPRGLTRRKSITLDNPLFEKDSEISTEPEVSPLDEYQVIEACGPSEEPISEESENEAEDIENVPTAQKKVLKINMNFGKDEDSDDDSIGSSAPSGKESDTESSTEA
ncbi:uncharacterized protein LOC134269468 [Saccostrea cucullata]|uniref:uncharacterized protein LOC134269468 n=1 Tax=Saccostrea cuccullata TaxID=36930 RepID=UPI002ED16E4D